MNRRSRHIIKNRHLSYNVFKGPLCFLTQINAFILMYIILLGINFSHQKVKGLKTVPPVQLWNFKLYHHQIHNFTVCYTFYERKSWTMFLPFTSGCYRDTEPLLPLSINRAVFMLSLEEILPHRWALEKSFCNHVMSWGSSPRLFSLPANAARAGDKGCRVNPLCASCMYATRLHGLGLWRQRNRGQWHLQWQWCH